MNKITHEDLKKLGVTKTLELKNDTWVTLGCGYPSLPFHKVNHDHIYLKLLKGDYVFLMGDFGFNMAVFKEDHAVAVYVVEGSICYPTYVRYGDIQILDDKWE